MKNVWDMPIDQTVGDLPVNVVAGPVNDVATAVFDIPVTGVVIVVMDTQPTYFIVVNKNSSGNIHALHPSKTNILSSKKMPLLSWIFKHFEQGLQVTTQTVCKVAEEIKPTFHENCSMVRIRPFGNFFTKLVYVIMLLLIQHKKVSMKQSWHLFNSWIT